MNWVNSNIKLKGNVAEHTQFAPSTLWAIGKNNEAKVMLRLASPALLTKAMRSAISLSRFLEKPASHSPFQRLVRQISYEQFFISEISSLIIIFVTTVLPQ
jgi:hypothetical protein